MKRIETLQDLVDLKKSILDSRDPNKLCITVCGGTGCRAYGSGEIADLIAKDIMKRNTYTSAPSAYQEIPASIPPSAYQETPEPSQEPSRTEEKVEARVEYDKNQKRRIIIRKRG